MIKLIHMQGWIRSKDIEEHKDWAKNKRDMEYFGTSLTDHGHYTWDLSGDYMVKIGLMPEAPFDPYEVIRGKSKGEVGFMQIDGYTVIGIEGSCKDTRNGTKSVFWLREIISREQMVERIKSNKHAMDIITRMPFEVKW